MKTLLLSAVLCAAMGCGGTQGGNPSLSGGKTPVSFVLGANTNSQVTALSLCVQAVALLDTDGVTPLASSSGTGDTPVSNVISPLGSPVTVANRAYGGVALQLSGSCSSGSNLRVANTHGALAVAGDLTLVFAGAFTVSKATGAVLLGVQAIVDQLASATSADQAGQVAGSVSGQASSVEFWRPELNSSWQIQLTTPVDQTVDASVYVIDLFDNDASIVNSLHARGRRAVCSVSVGSWEAQRPDAASFPGGLIGSGINGSANEKYLDIRQVSTLSPIMAARFELCKARGFDAVVIDNTDGYANSSGFPLSARDQLTYNLLMAALAHTRGLSIALQGDIDQVAALAASFDFGVNQQCFEFGECNLLLPYIRSAKPVFEFETHLTTGQFCSQANSLGFNAILKNASMDAARSACR